MNLTTLEGNTPTKVNTDKEHNLTMLKAGIGATEDTLRESDAAPGSRAETRRQPRRRDRAVQGQQR